MKRSMILAACALTGGCMTAHERGSGLAPTMVPLAPGSFLAGSTSGETAAVHMPQAYVAREQPARTVTIARRFAMARTEVTRSDFARFVAATGRVGGGPCSYLADGPGNRWETDTAHDWRNPGFVQSDDHPVVCVSFDDAQAYAAWLSGTTGRRFRLPTGDEWEYAARAGTSGMRWWGDASPCTHANVADRARARADLAGVVDPATVFDCDDGHARTAPVAAYQANPWGLHDMLGNVWEWTLDCAEPSVPVAACASPIDRGGSWTNSPKYLRAAVRHPDLREARTTVLGFRLVEELAPR